MLGWDAATFFTEKKKRRSARRLCSVVELFCLVELVLFCLIVLGNAWAAVPLIPRWWAEIKRQEDVGLKCRRRGAAACCFSFPHRWVLRGGGCMGWSSGTGAMSASHFQCRGLETASVCRCAVCLWCSLPIAFLGKSNGV